MMNPMIMLDKASSTKTAEPPAPQLNDVYRQIGNRIRQRRTELGLSQRQLASMAGLAYHQANMYESGLARISAERLLDVAMILDVSIAWFFEDLLESPLPTDQTPPHAPSTAAVSVLALDRLTHGEALSQMARSLANQSLARKNRA